MRENTKTNPWFRIKACWLLLTSNRCAVFAFYKPSPRADALPNECRVLATPGLLVRDVAALQAWVSKSPAATLGGLQLLTDTQALLDGMEPLAEPKSSGISEQFQKLPGCRTATRNTPRGNVRSFGVYVKGGL